MSKEHAAQSQVSCLALDHCFCVLICVCVEMTIEKQRDSSKKALEKVVVVSVVGFLVRRVGV